MRSTGYPLYLTLGGLWSRLPIGDVGYRMNLFSAFSGALTIFFADRTLRKLGVSGWASARGAGSARHRDDLLGHVTDCRGVHAAYRPDGSA